MKKSKKIVLIITPVLGSLLFSACRSNSSSYYQSTPSSTTRDVYQSIDDCKKDWGEQDLCEQMNDTDTDEYRRNGGVIAGRGFRGPNYYPGDRAVSYKGKTIAPTSTSTSLKSFTVTSSSSSSSRSSVSSPRTSSYSSSSSSSSSSSRGGFGGGGYSSSS